MSIVQNLAEIEKNIKNALTNRKVPAANLSAVKIIAVTKNQSCVDMREAIDAGITAIGENRVQEAAGKFHSLERSVEWHLIGHLQTNKVKQAINMFDLIHSVDSERLAAEINRLATKAGKRQAVLVQVNVAGEETKFGVARQQVVPLARLISEMEYVHLCGLMTIAPIEEKPEATRPVFRELFNIFGELCSLHLPNTGLKWLSMGMTSDYRIAVEEGANLVRIGTGIFGERPYKKGVSQL